MKKEEITLIAQDTILNFQKRVEKPIILFLNKKRFTRYLNFTPLKKHIEQTPCFIAEMKGGNVIYYCKEIIEDITKEFPAEKKKQFVEAITIHELLHIWNRAHHFKGNASISEQEVWREMETYYPKHFTIVREIVKQTAF